MPIGNALSHASASAAQMHNYYYLFMIIIINLHGRRTLVFSRPSLVFSPTLTQQPQLRSLITVCMFFMQILRSSCTQIATNFIDYYYLIRVACVVVCGNCLLYLGIGSSSWPAVHRLHCELFLYYYINCFIIVLY